MSSSVAYRRLRFIHGFDMKTQKPITQSRRAKLQCQRLLERLVLDEKMIECTKPTTAALRRTRRVVIAPREESTGSDLDEHDLLVFASPPPVITVTPPTPEPQLALSWAPVDARLVLPLLHELMRELPAPAPQQLSYHCDCEMYGERDLACCCSCHN